MSAHGRIKPTAKDQGRKGGGKDQGRLGGRGTITSGGGLAIPYQKSRPPRVVEMANLRGFRFPVMMANFLEMTPFRVLVPMQATVCLFYKILLLLPCMLCAHGCFALVSSQKRHLLDG